VDIKTGAIKAGQELAIRYRFASDGDADSNMDPDYNVDVALIDNSGMVLEEFRNAGAYNAGALATVTVDDNDPARTPLPTGTLSMDVNVTNTIPAGNTLDYAKYGLWSYNNIRMCSTCPDEGLRGATAFGLKAKAADVATQDHEGVWEGTTVAFWGSERSESDSSIDSSGSVTDDMLGLARDDAPAEIVVNFNNGEVTATMGTDTDGIGTANNVFLFTGTLGTDRLGYTAEVDTTVPTPVGSINAGRTGGTLGELDSDHTLAHDSTRAVHARGELSGAFYGPPSAAGSTVLNARAPAETAGTWRVTDVPNIATADKTRTVVIGAFGAQLTSNRRPTP
jgi:hypothetical protein